MAWYDVALGRRKPKPRKSRFTKTKEEQRELGKKTGGTVAKGTKAGAQKLGIEAKSIVKTKGGEFEKFEKGSLKEAKKRGKIKQTFGEAFKSNCAGKGADHTFSWTSPSGKKNSYSCKKG